MELALAFKTLKPFLETNNGTRRDFPFFFVLILKEMSLNSRAGADRFVIALAVIFGDLLLVLYGSKEFDVVSW